MESLDGGSPGTISFFKLRSQCDAVIKCTAPYLPETKLSGAERRWGRDSQLPAACPRPALLTLALRGESSALESPGSGTTDLSFRQGVTGMQKSAESFGGTRRAPGSYCRSPGQGLARPAWERSLLSTEG